MNYNSVTVRGHDYTIPLRDMLPTIIGKRSKPPQQIAATAGRRPQSVRNVLERLHAKGQVHIKRWTRAATGPFIACYFWGPGKDAPKPPAMTNAEKSARYRNTEKGKATYAACRKRFLKSDKGIGYSTSYSRSRRTRQLFESGGIAAIDPLLAAVMGQRNPPEKEL